MNTHERRPSVYTVLVDDNFHYQDDDERYEAGIYETLEQAIGACKRIVEESLAEQYQPGMSEGELYMRYTSFGDDPFIRGAEPGSVPFSAWDYARRRCWGICSTKLE